MGDEWKCEAWEWLGSSWWLSGREVGVVAMNIGNGMHGNLEYWNGGGVE